MNKTTTEPIIIRKPAGGWIGSMFVTVIIGALTVMMLGMLLYMLAGSDFSVGLLPGTIIAATIVVMGVLTRYVLRDALGKKGWQIILHSNGLDLQLPRWRSLIHRLAAVNVHLDYADIEAIETRLEVYRSFGMANMHRSYALKLKSDEVIILGEDRALATGLETAYLENAVNQIIEISQLEVRDLGMARGKGGILSVVNTCPPPWDAANLEPESQAREWTRVTRTGMLMRISILIVIIAIILQAVF